MSLLAKQDAWICQTLHLGLGQICLSVFNHETAIGQSMHPCCVCKPGCESGHLPARMLGHVRPPNDP